MKKLLEELNEALQEAEQEVMQLEGVYKSKMGFISGMQATILMVKAYVQANEKK